MRAYKGEKGAVPTFPWAPVIEEMDKWTGYCTPARPSCYGAVPWLFPGLSSQHQDCVPVKRAAWVSVTVSLRLAQRRHVIDDDVTMMMSSPEFGAQRLQHLAQSTLSALHKPRCGKRAHCQHGRNKQKSQPEKPRAFPLQSFGATKWSV